MKPLNRIPILCTASILYLFIIGRNLSTKQTLAAARTQAGEVWIGAAMECHQDITPETPSLASAGAAHACLCSPWNAAHG